MRCRHERRHGAQECARHVCSGGKLESPPTPLFSAGSEANCARGPSVRGARHSPGGGGLRGCCLAHSYLGATEISSDFRSASDRETTLSTASKRDTVTAGRWRASTVEYRQMQAGLKRVNQALRPALSTAGATAFLLRVERQCQKQYQESNGQHYGQHGGRGSFLCVIVLELF